MDDLCYRDWSWDPCVLGKHHLNNMRPFPPSLCLQYARKEKNKKIIQRNFCRPPSRSSANLNGISLTINLAVTVSDGPRNVMPNTSRPHHQCQYTNTANYVPLLGVMQVLKTGRKERHFCGINVQNFQWQARK